MKKRLNKLRRLRLRSDWLMCGLLSAAVPALAAAQAGVSYIRVPQGGPLDPVRDVATMPLVGSFHAPLAEEYIWTAGDAAVLERISNPGQVKRDDWKVEPHRFRRTFHLDTVPQQATLYIAGPRHARVWINGQLAAEFDYKPQGHMSFRAQAESVARWLRAGENTIAIEAVRGYGSSHHTNSLMTRWLNSGEVLAVKIVPAAESVDAKPLLISSAEWRSSLEAGRGWDRSRRRRAVNRAVC